MAKHLNRAHNMIFEISDQADQGTPRLTDMPCVQVMKPLPGNVVNLLNESLAIALATTSAPYRLVTNQSFIKFVELLNRSYNFPSPITIAKHVEGVFNCLMKKLLLMKLISGRNLVWKILSRSAQINHQRS